MKIKKINILAIFILLFLFTFNSNSAEILKIIDIITDSQNSSGTNQIAIQFNRPIVSYGTRNTDNIPIDINPNVNCQWQWINDSLLVCYLANGERFHLATTYNIKIKKDFKTFDGASFGEEKNFSFTTLKPDASYVNIIAWKNSGKPVFRLSFNQIVNTQNLEKTIFIIDANDRKKTFRIKLLDEQKYLGEYEIKQQHDQFLKFFPNNEIDEKENKSIIFFEPEENLAINSNFKVILDHGITSAHGPESIIGTEEVFSFKTFDEPKLLSISCNSFKDGHYNEIKINLEDEFDESKKCLPDSFINLNFSSPILTKDALQYLKFTPELSSDVKNNLHERLTQKEEKDGQDDLGYPIYGDGMGYSINLYGTFLPNQIYNIQSITSQNQELPNKLKNLFNFSKDDEKIYDIFGKEFKQKINFNFMFDHYQPELSFPQDESINVLERSTSDDLAVTSRNFKEILIKYNIISADTKSKNQLIAKNIENEDDVFIKTPLEIRKLLNNKSGLVFGELIGKPKESSYSEYKNQFFTQITNFGIIGKIGHYNSLIYVTDLTTGEPVVNANVSIIKSKFLEFSGSESETLASGKTDEDGILILPGTENFDKNLKTINRYYDGDGIIIQVKKGEEMGWLPIRYNNAMSTWQIPNVSSAPSKKYGHLNGWGFTSQGIYKPNDDVNYKLYIRNNTNEKLTLVQDLTYKLIIKDPTGATISEENDIKFSDFGTYSGEYKLTKIAKSGWYEIILIPNLKDLGIEKEEYEQDMSLQMLKFLVSDFKTSSFKIRTEIDKHDVFYKDDIEISNYSELYSGGAFSNAPTNINVDIEPQYFSPKAPITAGFNFNDLDKQKDLFTSRVTYKNGMTDINGEFSNKVKIENDQIQYGKIIIDSSVQDDSGKMITNRTYANYFGVDKFVGLKITDFFYRANQKNPVQFLVTDSSGNLIENIDVNIEIQYGENHIAQFRTAGNTYIPKSSTEWKPVGSCNMKSKLEINECEFDFTKAGDYKAIATIRDSKNLASRSSIEFIVFDEDKNIVWSQQNNENFEILAEKTHYKVGEKAKFIVKNPLIGANALITTERYGVIKKFTKKFDKSIEVLEFDLDEKDAPGFYLSVVLTMPRINNYDSSSEKNDLYKPTAKIGYSKIFVENPNNNIKVDIISNKDQYKPKENSLIKLSLNEKNKINEAEVAVIVIDEAVLDLISNKANYFNPESAFSQLQALDVMNYSLFKTILTNTRAMMKGANVGGDGGVDFSIRSNFVNIAYWNPSITLRKGESKEIQFELPDNLTNWKVIVVSNDKSDLFGLDTKDFKVNKETEIRPLLPDHIITGDKFNAGFTILNRTDKTRRIIYDVTISGMISDSKQIKNQYTNTITFEPFSRKVIKFPVISEQINDENSDLFKDTQNRNNKISFSVKAYDDIDGDIAEYSVNVLPSIIHEDHFNNKIIDDKRFHSTLNIDNDVFGNLSSLKIGLYNSIASGLVNIFSFVKDYQYDSLEQKLSKMFVGAQYLNLKDNILKNNYKKIFTDFSWDDARKNIAELYEQIPNYQTENGGMSYYIPSDYYASPYLSAITLWMILKFESIYDTSKLPDMSKTKEKLISYLENLLQHDSQYQNNQTFENDVKATIVEIFTIMRNKPDEVLRYKDDFEKMSLFGKAKMLNGAILSNVDQNLIKKWWSDITQNAVTDGSQYMYFKNNQSREYNPLMHSSKYTENCSILETITSLQKSQYDIKEITGTDKEDFKKIVGKIANSIVNRKDDKKFFNTHEAMLCTNSIIEYAKINENLNLSAEQAEITIEDEESTFSNKSLSIPGNFNIDNLTKIVGKNSKIDVLIPGQQDEKNKNFYYSSHLSLAKTLNFREEINHGIEIKRKYQIEKDRKFFDLGDLNQLSNGSVVKVTLSITAPTNKYFVIIDDYIPGCFEPIDKNQETSLKIRDEENTKNSYFYYQDLRQNYARFYSDFAPSGTHEVSYFVQVISNGVFDILPAIAKEMYNEETFGTTNSQRIYINGNAQQNITEKEDFSYH